MKSLAEQRRTTRSDSDANPRDPRTAPSVRSSGKWSKGPPQRLREATVRSSCTGQRPIAWAWRVQKEGEGALTDERHGHPVKLRGEVLTFLTERCQISSDLASSALRCAIQEHFASSGEYQSTPPGPSEVGIDSQADAARKKAQNRLG